VAGMKTKNPKYRTIGAPSTVETPVECLIAKNDVEKLLKYRGISVQEELLPLKSGAPAGARCARE